MSGALSSARRSHANLPRDDSGGSERQRLGFWSQLRGVLGQLLWQLRVSISPALVEELTRVLRNRCDWSEYDFQEDLDPLLALADIVRPRRRLEVVVDPDDNRVIECALSARASVIITGDDHLLRLQRYRGIEILTPRDFLNAISE